MTRGALVAAIVAGACRYDVDRLSPASDGGSGGDAVDGPTMPPAASVLVTGEYHTCVLDGSEVRCWGYGNQGALGYGSTANVGDDEAPVLAGAVPLGASVVGLAAGGYHTCALVAGAMRCWGQGSDGELGYASVTAVGDDEPVSTVGDIDVGGPVVGMGLGSYHTCAILEGGALRCWGQGQAGALGYGNRANVGDTETPSAAGDVPVGGPVIAVAGGEAHTCVVLAGGAVRCFGEGAAGQLGYGNVASVGDDEAPSTAGDVPLGTAAAAIACGLQFSCALLVTGAVRCWGDNSHGQLGTATTSDLGDDELPSTVGDISLGAPAVAVSAGGYHTCVLLEGGAVRCFGWGMHGELGYGNLATIGDDEPPSAAGDVPIGGPAVAIASGDYHSCALLASGAVRCWGWNMFGELGYGNVVPIGDDEPASTAGDVPYR